MLYLPPLLRLHSSNLDAWEISYLLISDNSSFPIWTTAGNVNLHFNSWKLLYIDNLNDKQVYFYQASIKHLLQDKAQIIEINFSHDSNDISRSLNLPAKGKTPNMTYSSCNGFSDADVLKNLNYPKFNMWNRLYEMHKKQPFELMLMGGDQIYADEIFYQKNSDFYSWIGKVQTEQMAAKWTENMEKTAKNFYLKQYINKWSASGGDKNSPQENEAFNYMISHVPSIMMWDDHDIIDGWGSFKQSVQESLQKTVYSELFKIAQTYFCLFQQHRLPQQSPNTSYIVEDNLANKSSFYTLGDSGLLVLDLRSERTYTQIISTDSWEQIFAKIPPLLQANNFKHLLVMSSIPVAHPDLSWLENKVDSVLLPNSINNLADDLHDQWTSGREHLDERKKLIKELLCFAINHKTRVTLLSGDVHIAANGLIQSHRNDANKNARSINQITCSGIVHPAPNAILTLFYSAISKSYEVDRDICLEMLNMPNINKQFIAARNFVTINKEETDNSLQVCWHVEDMEYPFKKWIHVVR